MVIRKPYKFVGSTSYGIERGEGVCKVFVKPFRQSIIAGFLLLTYIVVALY